MNKAETIERLNNHEFTFLRMLNAKVIDISAEEMTCTMEFNISKDFCHSVDVIQGGFVTAMLDAVSSHAAFALADNISNVSSLEIKTNFLEPSRAGHIKAVGKIIKLGYKIAFMEAQLYNSKGDLTATASTVGKIIRA